MIKSSWSTVLLRHHRARVRHIDAEVLFTTILNNALFFDSPIWSLYLGTRFFVELSTVCIQIRSNVIMKALCLSD